MRVLAAVNGVLASVLFGALTVVVALQVVTRFVLHIPFIWSEEAARFLFFWVVMLGSAMSVRGRRHFVIDVAMGSQSKLRPAVRFALDLIPDLVVLAFSVVLLTQGIGYTEVGLNRVASNSRVNMALVYAAIPVFAALTVVYAGTNLIGRVMQFRRGEEPEPRPSMGGE